ncbi:right origin-binding protein [Salmonella enterica subsp. enterica]|uniref:Right origin-binding protein n=1 Tax=Salmonella enterica I TaxID=59201 RepID=A0A379X1A8_SALET|nr:right origin-binding protein [Salmonella enterica subsp. enterica]
MDQAGIIRDLLIWLEGHLDQPLSLDKCGGKSRLFQVAPAENV